MWKHTDARSKQSGSLAEIMRSQQVARDDECDVALQQALRESALEAGITSSQADMSANDDEMLQAAIRASLTDLASGDDASLALALQLQEESDQSAAQRERHRLAKVRGTLARNERVRVLSREEACREAQYQRKEPVEAPDEPEASAFAQVVESEGIILDASGRSGLIGRRADGSLVSKHDAALDARLKAQILHDRFDGAGDIESAKVPGRVYNELVRKSNAQHRHVDVARRKQVHPGTKQHSFPAVPLPETAEAAEEQSDEPTFDTSTAQNRNQQPSHPDILKRPDRGFQLS